MTGVPFVFNVIAALHGKVFNCKNWIADIPSYIDTPSTINLNSLMILGLDVCHGVTQNTKTSNIALCGSYDKDFSQYHTVLKTQKFAKTEIVEELGLMVEEVHENI
jgi:hypothetical protein